MYAVTCTHSLPSLSLELDPGTSGIGIDALTFVRSATVFHSLSTGLKYRLRCSWYWELLSNCWQWGHRCLHLDRLFLPLVSPCKPFLFILCDTPAFYNLIYRYKQPKTRWKLSPQTCEFLQIRKGSQRIRKAYGDAYHCGLRKRFVAIDDNCFVVASNWRPGGKFNNCHCQVARHFQSSF